MKTERLIIFIILITALLVPQTILAQEKQGMQMGRDHGQMMSHPEMMDDHMKVHHEHIQTMERVFRYERNISGRADDIRVGYLYKDGDADSEKDKDVMVMMAKTMVEKGMAGKSISFIPIGVSSDKVQDSLLAKEKVNVIYLGRGLTDAEFNAAKNYAGNEKILTIGSTGAQAEAGITAVGIVVQPEKVNLIINLITAREQGADFDPRLFRLADKVIK
jgi:hypothetical protein